MSLFRKPKKPLQRRVFTAADGDDDDEPMETMEAPPAPPPPRIRERPREKEKDKAAKQTLLSFADEEDDGEVFRVKKSSQSKRLARAREKERRRAAAPEPPPAPAPASHVTNSRDLSPNDKVERGERDGAGERSRLEGLVLSGRAALAAGADGDVDDEPDTYQDDAGFHAYRPESVRAALTRGQIPDAALIHAARKTRQQARETGLGHYIPLSTGGGGGGGGGGAGGGGGGGDDGAGSRLVREDGSGDDDEDERLAVRGIIDERRQERGAGDPGDSGDDEWETQQLQKAVAGAAGAAADPDGMQLNLFAVGAPPAPSFDAPPHLRPLHIEGDRTAAALKDALVERLRSLRATRAAAAASTTVLRARLLAALRARDTCCSRAPGLAAAYRSAQAARAYFTDLIECIDEKMSSLETLEARALQLHRRRCDTLAERRRADTRDQAQDVLALAARAGAARAPECEQKTRRAAEREGRRRARRLAREAASPALAALHTEGDSSDDELPHAAALHEAAEREALGKLSAQVLADALPAWRSVRGVCRRVARLRRAAPRAYRDAYVAECLPRLLAPYVRAEIVVWNPLADQDNDDYEKMDWYKCLLMYGLPWERREDSDSSSDEDCQSGAPVTEQSVRDDPDLMLAPTVVARVLLPKITELVEQAWDPLCVRATTRLRALLLRAAALPPRALPARERLARAVRARLHAALAADVFLPALPQPIMDGKGGVFWRRCLGAGLRLLRAALALCPPPPPLHGAAPALRLVDTLCCAAGAAPPTAAALAASLLARALPRAESPLRAAALARVAALAAAAVARLHPDNPLHLKSLEQARGVLAEARAEGVTPATSG